MEEPGSTVHPRNVPAPCWPPADIVPTDPHGPSGPGREGGTELTLGAPGGSGDVMLAAAPKGTPTL